MSQVLDFVPLWTLILGMAVFFYVLFDGSISVSAFGLAPDATSRNTIMHQSHRSSAGNETWLVFGGLGLLAAFPLAFAIIIPAVYFPILLVRGWRSSSAASPLSSVSDAESRAFADHAFYFGSGIATFAQAGARYPLHPGFSGERPAIRGEPRSTFCPHSRS